ncbi:hypothetical protein ASPZODRAFT_12582 [Penicilliopsis zonata CBS 506.65]|uniref:FHA domain-containing protein n=1 Tax=Penicilliopsis zonata CBS 506.65 TaxID=1073090 RepID=A0A1L9SXJ8_9EURO|nr:hypothetical protein ASPZODRAFT_12582 [Penicilliopsis zonata CBS 506.65]OJJ51773.1 hypothetical protein ASPZODRAFT_12582 [Penicilliopsis zonata CBS 506.65]
MWILDSDGDFLEGKRVWLKPGKQYLFGRIRQDGVRHAIGNASISRKHMVIEVSPVKPGDGSHIHARSEISVIDQGSKCGTIVNGEQIRGDSKKLNGEEHTIKIGKYQHLLRITWQPTVLSFSLSSKELKVRDPLVHVRSRLEDLDIKTVIPYLVDKTTHVVQSKRNTAKGLQALINGKYIVQESFLDAVVYAATPSDLENIESLSPLESDFDSAWPDAMEHLPPPGKEPVQRSADAFAPNPSRLNIFEGYTFVFGDSMQFENLQASINNGHGKALFYQVEDGVTTAEEIVQFMRNASGGKGIGAERSDPGGVVLVRFRSKGRYENWSIEISNQIAVMIDQRVIEQSEFLDAILGNDAAPLCRPLPSEPDLTQESDTGAGAGAGTSSQRALTQTSATEVVDDEASQPTPELSLKEEPTQRSRSGSKRPRVRSFVSKVKNFDDGFDMNSIPVYTLEDDEVIPDSVPPVAMEPIPEEQTQPDRMVDENEEEDVLSALLPGAKAMKRHRAEMSRHQVDDPGHSPKEESLPRPKRPKLDVREAARQHREAAEEKAHQRRQAEEEALQASLKDVDVEKMKNLAIVEEMDIKPRTPSEPLTDDRDRWDERWNGRKNFKKFRRKGDPSHTRQRIQTVIVPLEEVVRKEFGVGEHHWVSIRKSPDPGAVESGSGPRDAILSREATGTSTSQRSLRTESEAPPPSLRQQKRTREVQDSDSEEDLRFRFRRKR